MPGCKRKPGTSQVRHSRGSGEGAAFALRCLTYYYHHGWYAGVIFMNQVDSRSAMLRGAVVMLFAGFLFAHGAANAGAPVIDGHSTAGVWRAEGGQLPGTPYQIVVNMVVQPDGQFNLQIVTGPSMTMQSGVLYPLGQNMIRRPDGVVRVRFNGPDVMKAYEGQDQEGMTYHRVQ